MIEATDAHYEELPYLEPNYSESYLGRAATIELVVEPEHLQPLNPKVLRRVLTAVLQINDPEKLPGMSWGSGFVMYDAQSQKAHVYTAGHVVNNSSDYDDLSFLTNEGLRVSVPSMHSYYDGLPEGYPATEASKNINDIAVSPATLPYIADRALQSRDIKDNPLTPGEQLYLINYQGRHHPGEPAVYTMLYQGVSPWNERMGDLIGDIQPDQEEDQTEPGDSGGVVVDGQGRVVGMSTGAYLDEKLMCDKPLRANSVNILRQNIPVSIVVPSSKSDECTHPISRGVMRMLGADNTFDLR